MNRISRTNQEWITLLGATGDAQAHALADLHQLLLRSVHHTFSKYLTNVNERERVGRLAEDCTQEALITLLAHLQEFRGESQFTTWAFKFGINKALATARREQWRGISLDALTENRAPEVLHWEARQTGANAEQIQAQKETWGVVQMVILTELSDRQRQVLIWMAFEDVPMDVVTERLNTNRNAIYKVLHDARQKVKRRLEAQGYTFEEILQLFAAG